MQYIEIYNNLKKSINEKGLSFLFSQSIKDFKTFFDEDISTKFLRGLSDLDDTRKRTKRINYLIRKNKLKTKRVLNIYEVRGINKYKTDVISWGHDKKNLPFKRAELTANEKRQIQEIKQIHDETGINLFNHVELNFNDRRRTTDAFNLGGGAVVRDVKVIQVGNYAIMKREEVLYIVVEADNGADGKADKARVS